MNNINPVTTIADINNKIKGLTTLLGLGITFAVLNINVKGDTNNSIIKFITFFAFIINHPFYRFPRYVFR